MIEIKYSIRTFIYEKNNQVLCRVRWNKKAFEVSFVTGVYAQPTKWDSDQQKAKKGTSHIVRNMQFSASQINDRIAEFREAIELCFDKCAIKNVVPTTTEFKEMVNEELGRNEQISKPMEVKAKSFEELFHEFLQKRGYQKNWDDDAKEKYQQAYSHITAAVPDISVAGFNINYMYKLREWYIKMGYKNRTVNKQIVMLKSFLRWIDKQDGYSIPNDVLAFETNLKVMAKTVTFLSFDELQAFANYVFDEERLSHARDLWCFMAFTSLRYSDLADLKRVHIIGRERIEKYTQKTDEKISIPLTEHALSILDKYKESETGEKVFPIISNQKLNDYIKEAAKVAGLDRLITDTYYSGTNRVEEIHPFHEIISCHDARRTFVSCSLAMGIPAEVVMKCTGHRGYKTMQPYIATATETQKLEMEKWNRSQYRSQIIAILDQANEQELKLILNEIRQLANLNT